MCSKSAAARCALSHTDRQATCSASVQAKEDETADNYSCAARGASFKSKGELHGHMQREHAQQPSEKTAIGQEKTKEQG